MDRSTPGSWVLHSPSPLGTAAADAEAPGREPQQLRCGAQDPDFQHGGAHSHGEEADNPGPSSCPMPCLRQNWATPDAGRRQPPSSFPLQLSLLGRSDLTQETPIVGVGAHSIPTPPQQQCPSQQGPRSPETHGATTSCAGWKRWVSSAARGHSGKRPQKLELQRHLLENQGKRPLVINLLNSESK